MEKRKIIIASILKPVNDTRLFEKFGLSLSQSNKYEVHIIGFYSPSVETAPDITFYPLFNFSRTSLKRITASWKFYKTVFKVKPQLIIATTAELLIVSVAYKIIFGGKLCYDVQENYYRNIRYTPTYPLFIRSILAHLVKFIEYASQPWIDQYFLAEECYTYERSFPAHKSKVVLNKFKSLSPIQAAKPLSQLPKIRFLYTGTIAVNYGILDAIRFTNNISKLYPDISLEIIGFAPDPHLLGEIQEMTAHIPFIHLNSSSTPIPHQEIITAMAHADFALLPYQPDKSIENCFPTKIWEYMAHGLPMIIQNHPNWVNYCLQYQSCLAIDYKNYSSKAVIAQIITRKFYSCGTPNDIFWHSEELTLLKSIDSL